ncbi:hypothetical protein L210DRAFT_984359 [Boletus edulis BED1]|uniref:Uncharacterized protein n=1 Tax=Boletus edulis BED1 TaxID=1328754 RepID=A0AAD4BKY3_BOLED|nr:hypothetical protein L210DRAFT_984359 [Boletus edulis BED1]
MFASSDQNKLKEALQAGGAKDFNFEHVKKQRVESIDYYPIPTVDLVQLVHKISAFDWESSDPWLGHVCLDVSTKSLIGVGAFKTAQITHLMLSPLRPTGLGSLPNQSIIIKWSYIITGDKTAQLGSPFVYPSLGEEANQLYHEANIMYWVKVLLKLTYNYINRAVDNADQALPFEIPYLHFVDAGLLLAFTEHHNPI